MTQPPQGPSRPTRPRASLTPDALNTALALLEEARALLELVSARMQPAVPEAALYCVASHLDRIRGCLGGTVIPLREGLGQLELAHDAVIVWELDGSGIVYWNRGAERLYGFPRAEALGKITHDLLRTRLAGGVSTLEATLARFGMWVGELHHMTRDGRRITVESRLTVISQQQGPWLILEVNRDATDRTLDAARQATQERLASLRQRAVTD